MATSTRKHSQSQSQQPATLSNMRDELMNNQRDEEDEEHDGQGEQRNQNEGQNQSQQQKNTEATKKEKQAPPQIPVDRLFFEACKKTGIDPTSAWNKSASMPVPPAKHNNSSSSPKNPRNNNNSNRNTNAQSTQNENNSRPQSAASSTNNNDQQQGRPRSRASSTASSSVDSVQKISVAHRFGAVQEKQLRDLLTVLQERKQIMQNKALHVTRNRNFQKKLKQKAAVLKGNDVLNAAWEAEMRKRQETQQSVSEKNNISHPTITTTKGKNSSLPSKNTQNQDQNNQQHQQQQQQQKNDHDDDGDDDDAAPSDIGSHYSLAVESLGKAGEDALFELALRQRQMWDLRSMRQQRARDRRDADYALRLHHAQERAEEEWRRQERESVEARQICLANHVQVKRRRERDEAHIAHVEARTAAIDRRRTAEYEQRVADIRGARTRRDHIMRNVVDQQAEHARHLHEVGGNARRIDIERRALIENSIEDLEQQRTKHEFLRFIRDVELANRSLVERDRMLVVVNRAERLLEDKRLRIQEGFAKTEEAAKLVEMNMAERSRALADDREQRHYEARTARIANDEQNVLKRFEKAQHEQEARERKDREDQKRSAAFAARYEQRRSEQEDRVDRLSKKMMAKRDEIIESSDKKHQTAAERQMTARKIKALHLSGTEE